MNKQDLAILIQTMEAQRKAGGFSFDVMPLAAQTMQKLSDLFNLMKPENRLIIEVLPEVPDFTNEPFLMHPDELKNSVKKQ